MAVNVKLGVDLGNFNQQINQAKESIKGFDASLKFAESAFKATGDAEAKLTTKTAALNGKLKEQERMVKAYADALQKARSAGVDPLSTEYQKLQTQMINAQAAMMETQAALNGLTTSEQAAAQGASVLEKNVAGIGKKMSLDQVISGLDRINTGLEHAAKKAVDLGKELWNAMLDKARWADDTQTMAQMYGIDVEQFQKMQKLVTNGMDTTVENMLAAQDRLYKGIGSDNKAALQALKDMHVSLGELKDTGGGILEFVDKDPQKVFFEIGRALYEMDEGYDKTSASQAIFGKSWRELSDLFKNYKSLEEYNAALENVQVTSEEDVSELAKLNDRIGELKGNLDTLSTDILAKLAPALNEGADALNGVLTTILEYLRTDEGKEQLQKLGDAISGLFGDLSKIDPDKVVQGFVEVFDKVTGGIQWLVDNADLAKGILATVVGAWGAIELGENVLKVVKLIDGIKGLGGAEAATAGASAGASWGTAFAAAVVKAAPWLVGIYTMLNPANAADDSFFDNATGMLTNEGWLQFSDFASGRLKDEAWQDVVNMVAERYGDMARILDNPAAINAMAKAIYGDHYFTGVDPKAQPDLYRTRINNELFDTLESLGFEPKIEIVPSEEVQQILENQTIELTVGDPTGRIKTPGGWKEPEVEVQPMADENAADELSAQIGVVTVGARISFIGGVTAGAGAVAGGLDMAARAAIYKGIIPGFANGIPWVNDTQLAMLHRGERVLTARENRQYTINNNTYFGGVNLHNRMEVDALTESIDRQNRRQQAAYGA